MFLKSKNLTFFGSSFIFLCFVLSFFQISFSQSFETPTLIYCPLQKTWVKRFEPKTPETFQSFDNICATDKRKNLVSFKISLKTFQPLGEKLFFDYLAKGDRVFTESNQFPDLPNRKLITHSNTEIALNNFAQNIEKTSLIHFSFAQKPRPPTTLISANFEFQIANTLKKISRHINPRSPPIFV